MRVTFTNIAILICALFAFTAAAQIRYSNELWISTKATANIYGTTNYANNGGTLDNPLDGSTEANFDVNMNRFPPNSRIHIFPGTYQTYGSYAWSVKPGQTITGSGIDITILQLVPGTPSPGSGTAVISGQAPLTNVEVSDLTCNCNYTSGSYTYSGVGLEGEDLAVRRVKVIHTAHFAGNSEAWGISIDGWPLSESDGNIIEECEVSGHMGGSVSAIAMGSAGTNLTSGIIRNNRVFLTPAGAGGAQEFAMNISSRDILVDGNFVNGAGIGIYCDTGWTTNLIVIGNTFRKCAK